MRIFLALILFTAVLFQGCKTTPDNLAWETNLETALQTAQKENKAVLVNFTGSDWCVWCKRLNEEVFSKPAFAKFASEKLVLVKIDFPKSVEQSPEVKMYNNQLAQRYNIEGFPTIVVMDKNGNVTGVTGYQPGGPENYVPHLQTLIK